MEKIAIIYASVHHGNTRKAAEYLAQKLPADAVDILKCPKPELEGYDTLIFASGIYLGDVHKALTAFMRSAPLEGRRVALLYTCGARYRDYAKAARALLLRRGADYLGDCWCRGFDTFGPLQYLGGIAKGRPNERDLVHLFTQLKIMLA